MCSIIYCWLLLLTICANIAIDDSFILGDDVHGRNVSGIVEDVRRQKAVADRLIELSTNGPAKGQLYTRLADFVDTYGSRPAGSQNLENSIDYIMLKMKEDRLENVHGEIVTIPHWLRGEESAYMVTPRYKKLAMLGLGTSIATPTSGIRAEVMVVKTFEELDRRASEAAGKIVVYNQDWVSYGESVVYRYLGASRAAAVGGVASLIRSVTPFSINSPHTGIQRYNASVPKIPTACITVEDAEMLWRMTQSGETIEVFLNMSAQTLPDSLSRNVVSEIVGSTYPEQVVLISGHIDSWDVGQGAMDDGAGALLGWQAISMIQQLGLRPKRTIRSVMWTAEEVGLVGAKGYFEQHKAHASDFVFAMESDYGTFKPKGLNYGGNNASIDVMREVMKLLAPINASELIVLEDSPSYGGDISFWSRAGIPGGLLNTQNEKYFYFHHTEGDTMDVLDSDDLDLCAALWAVVAYTVANIEEVLPRDLINVS